MADLAQIEKAVQGVLDQEAVELVDLQYVHEGGRWVLRFFLDKAGGVTLGDCEYLSNRIGGVLDLTDLLPRSYVLEVSSPGIDRLIKKERDFQRFSGYRVEIWLKTPEAGRRHYVGVLEGLEEGQVKLSFADQHLRLPLDRIEEARLHPELEI
jgi:ribosome maturation factor RimP